MGAHHNGDRREAERHPRAWNPARAGGHARAKSLSVNKSRDAFDPNAMGYAKDGEGRGRPHGRAGRQSRPRIGVKPFGNGQLGPIALSLGLPWGATQGCASLRALGPTCRVRTRDLLTDKLLGLRFLRRFRLARTVEGNCLANERLEGGLVNRFSFVDVDRAAYVSVETRVEETVRILQRRALGEGKLHDLLVGFASADDAVVRPNRSAHPLPLLDDVRVCVLDELAHSAEGFPAPVPEFGDSFRDELRCRLALARARLFHVLILDVPDKVEASQGVWLRTKKSRRSTGSIATRSSLPSPSKSPTAKGGGSTPKPLD